jgi:hypothetical protein
MHLFGQFLRISMLPTSSSKLAGASLRIPGAFQRLQRASSAGASWRRSLASRAQAQIRCSARQSSRLRTYSTYPPPPPRNSSGIKFWPLLVIIALSSGCYVALVKQRIPGMCIVLWLPLWASNHSVELAWPHMQPTNIWLAVDWTFH